MTTKVRTLQEVKEEIIHACFLPRKIILADMHDALDRIIAADRDAVRREALDEAKEYLLSNLEDVFQSNKYGIRAVSQVRILEMIPILEMNKRRAAAIEQLGEGK